MFSANTTVRHRGLHPIGSTYISALTGLNGQAGMDKNGLYVAGLRVGEEYCCIIKAKNKSVGIRMVSSRIRTDALLV